MATAKRLSVKTPLIEQSGQAEAVRNKLRRGSSAMFRKTLNGNPVIGRPAIELIRDGYLASMLKSASSFFNVSDARIQNIARVSATTVSRLEQKNAKIDAAATERVYRLSNVTRMAIDVFENQDAAIAWMRQPNNVLGDVAPLDLMDTEPGAVAVKQVLNAIATGGAA
jgi:putative toxin-antitoxin system antitoxin component (TIGR02293 family)